MFGIYTFLRGTVVYQTIKYAGLYHFFCASLRPGRKFVSGRKLKGRRKGSEVEGVGRQTHGKHSANTCLAQGLMHLCGVVVVSARLVRNPWAWAWNPAWAVFTVHPAVYPSPSGCHTVPVFRHNGFLPTPCLRAGVRKSVVATPSHCICPQLYLMYSETCVRKATQKWTSPLQYDLDTMRN